MLGDVVIIAHSTARAVTRMEDPEHDANVALTDAKLFEADNKVAEEEDICIYEKLCVSKAVYNSVCKNTEYCGNGSASEGSATLLSGPYPWTTRTWGEDEDEPVRKNSGVDPNGDR